MSDLIDREALLTDIYRNLPSAEMSGDVESKEDMRLWITARIENAPTIAKLPDNHGDLIDRKDYIKKWKETKKKRLFINGLDVAWLARVTIPARKGGSHDQRRAEK